MLTKWQLAEEKNEDQVDGIFHSGFYIRKGSGVLSICSKLFSLLISVWHKCTCHCILPCVKILIILCNYFCMHSSLCWIMAFIEADIFVLDHILSQRPKKSFPQIYPFFKNILCFLVLVRFVVITKASKS